MIDRHTPSFCVLGAILLPLVTGCETESRRPMIEYPPGTWRVRYESSEDYSSCLIASVVMAANYLKGERQFSEAEARAAMDAMGLDHTRVGDVKTYLQRVGLDLITLTGRLDPDPPTGLHYWSKSRRYPVICVVNRDEKGDPGFNHAVIVIGITDNPDTEKEDRIHYFDPSMPDDPLMTVPAAEFDAQWTRGERAMMIVVNPPS